MGDFRYHRHRSEPNSELRLVLVGQERSGKSSAGNTILGEKHFGCIRSEHRRPSCETKEGVVLNRRVFVVDTPGLSSTHLSKNQIKAELVNAVNLSSPGPHVFLLIIPVGRFSETEQKGLKTLKKMLSADVSEHTIVLFTFGDKLDKDINQFIDDDRKLQKLLQKCRGQYHVFNNREMGNRDQVRELLEKIHLVSKEGHKFYCRPKNVISYAFRWIRQRLRELNRQYEQRAQRRRATHVPQEIEMLIRQGQ